DMVNLALWLKKNDFLADQVQAFYPSPMATATAMYHSGKNPLRKVTYKSDTVEIVKSPEKRRLHKALLRYHDPKNWPMIREALKEMHLGHLIGSGEGKLVSLVQPRDGDLRDSARRKNTASAHEKRIRKGKALSQHTGLPPRAES
ncbi:MAG: DUF3362 domain-containing protein, partial [Woeseiaceae bacterium]